MRVHLAEFTALALLTASGTAVRLPGINGKFVEYSIQNSDSSVKVHLRDSYHDGIDAHHKRFYETYHNDTNKFEICAETNFVDTYNRNGALGSDCSNIMAELEANPGYFETAEYTGDDYNYLAVSGTCAFGVYRLDDSSSEVDIGSKDVVDNIYSALARFQRMGHVGAKGNFTCSNSVPISWAILKAP
ncbi:putative necrosis-inducing factor-domain-containing protein [Hypoxylon cercidicola]|nr:putative necrosis-inducing factor-domain-containing protein [Hypoxylon cercidicola]